MKSLRIILIAVLLVFMGSAIRGEKPQKPRFHSSTYKMTAKIYLKGEYRMYDSAVAILEEALLFYEDDAEIHFLLGKAYYYKNNYRGMGEQFASAESLKSKKAKWMDELNTMKKEKWTQVFNQGAEAFNEKDFDTALDKFSTCSIIDPSNFRSFLYTGLAYTVKGEYEEALSSLQTGLKLEPDNPEMLRGYADALFYAGKQQEALQSYNEILKDDSSNVEVLINVVSIYSNAKDFDQALAYSKKLVATDPTYKDGHFNMGTIFLQKIIQTNMSLDSLKDESGEYLKDEKSTDRVKKLAQKKDELLASAHAAFEKVLEIDSTDLEAQIFLAQVCQEQGNFDQALGILEPLVQKDSTNCSALNQLAIIYAKKGMGEEAKVAWQKAQDCFERQK
ncbi:MAG: hypothetical protein AMJ91_03040 [candidate division Zixibacteria bacterium SM23_73_3]|nr:MAG: hypothetical protein AMJ91_03040 [candidate division Zixibacteria bacterium SM23_73_3]